jgi:hypothetical protein
MHNRVRQINSTLGHHTALEKFINAQHAGSGPLMARSPANMPRFRYFAPELPKQGTGAAETRHDGLPRIPAPIEGKKPIRSRPRGYEIIPLSGCLAIEYQTAHRIRK